MFAIFFLSGNPVGQMSFVTEQGLSDLSWRDENFNDKMRIYPYGITGKESYRAACTIRHRADTPQPLNVVIQRYSCPMESCLSTLVDQRCQRSFSQNSLRATPKRVSDFQTQLIGAESQQLDDPSFGYQYLCCYEQGGLISIAKAMTVVSSKLEFGSSANWRTWSDRYTWAVSRPATRIQSGYWWCVDLPLRSSYISLQQLTNDLPWWFTHLRTGPFRSVMAIARK